MLVNNESMKKNLILDLGNNYKKNTEQILENYIDRYSTIASHKSNRKKDDNDLMPYIFNAVKMAYLRRGDEGTLSSSEGGISKQYVDIEEKLKKDAKNIRVIR